MLTYRALSLTKAFRLRMAQNVFYSNESVMPSKEFTIPVPWGHIAAKAWGNESGRPVLGLHGFLDNANTFLRLAPFLPKDLYFVCIDWPGHGLSSHRPEGTLYYHPDYVMDVKRVVDVLGWEKFSIIGHSMGGGVAFMFASVFSDAVEKLVLIESITPFPRTPEGHGERFSRCFHQLVKTESYNKEDEKLYTKEELLERFKVGHEWCTEESARILLERAVRPVSQTTEGVKYAFTRDPRIKITSPISYTPEEISSSSLMQKCEILCIKANDDFMKNRPYPAKEFIVNTIQKQCEILEKVCKKFVMVTVEGNHHTHLNSPEHSAPPIEEFFS